jgi:pimeloyl-ACP methyl ester carboxylesterase
MVYGTPVMRWLACLQDSARRQMMLRGSTDDAIAAQVAELARLADTGELNGRSAAYHAQLDALDLEAAWRGVTAPILVVRGEHDWVVADHDQARIADLAAGPTTIVDVPGLDHLFGWHADREASLRDYGIGVFDPAVVDATVAWLTTTV